jgi:hypothetical protein
MERNQKVQDLTLELHTSNSWRRFHFRHDMRPAGPACEPITQPDGHPDLHFPGGPDGEVARRFVACWNACKGLPTDMLEQVGEIVVEVGATSIQVKRTGDSIHMWFTTEDGREISLCNRGLTEGLQIEIALNPKTVRLKTWRRA